MSRHIHRIAVSLPAAMALTMLALGAIVVVQAQTPPGAQSQGIAANAGGFGTSQITGQVLAADTGRPVKRATVRARGGTPSVAGPSGITITLQTSVDGRSGSTLPPGMAQREVTPDDTGHFGMFDLPPGRYTVSVEPPAQFLPPRPQTIEVASGGSASVTFRLERGGAITGRVLDHEGDPLVRAQVSAYQRRNLTGTSHLMSAGSGGYAATDDLGQFRLFGLPPGEYYVVASYSMPGPMVDPPDADTRPRFGYAPTFYPSSIGADGAQKVRVRAGQDTRGVNVSLVRAQLCSISGRGIDAAGNSLSGNRGFVSLMPFGAATPMGLPGSSVRRADGTFVFANVPPGRYLLIATAGTTTSPPSGSREGAYKTVVVSGHDLVVDIQTNAGATITGHVVIEGGTPAASTVTSGPMAGMRARVSARALDPGVSMGMFVSPGTGGIVGDDLAFQLTGLRGPLALTASGPRMALKSVMYGGDDIMLKGLELSGTEKIDGVVVTLTTDVATIDGLVTAAAGEPGDAWVVVFPEDVSMWVPGSPFVRMTRTRPSPATMDAGRGAFVPGTPPISAYASRQGGFVMTGLLPGRYHVAALPYNASTNSPSDMAPATDREALAKLRAGAKTVEASAGQAASVELRLPK